MSREVVYTGITRWLISPEIFRVFHMYLFLWLLRQLWKGALGECQGFWAGGFHAMPRYIEETDSRTRLIDLLSYRLSVGQQSREG